MNSAMTEERLLQYLRSHRTLQHIGVVANANRCSVARVLELSMDLRNRGLIQIRAYSNGFHLQIINQTLKARGSWTEIRFPKPRGFMTLFWQGFLYGVFSCVVLWFAMFVCAVCLLAR